MDAFLQRSVTSLGRQVPQVTMERAAKRIKAEHDDSPGSLDSQDDDVDDSDNGEIAVPAEEVAPESSLPPVKTDKEAIEEYEIMRASQGDAQTASSSTTLDKRKWVKGKSSIYVDAFNLALDTVLEDESHLFSEAEVVVFAAWRQLDYEAQYLYDNALATKEYLTDRRPVMFGYFSGKQTRGTGQIVSVTTTIYQIPKLPFKLCRHGDYYRSRPLHRLARVLMGLRLKSLVSATHLHLLTHPRRL